MLQLLSARLQGGIRFLQFPLPTIRTAPLTESPAPTSQPGRNVGFTMFDCDDMDGVAPAYTPAASCVRVPQLHGMASWLHCHFGWSLSACLAPRILRCLWQFTRVEHFIQPCLSDRIDARSRGDRLAAFSLSGRWRDVVSAAFDPTVASRADADRLLRTEPQVRLTNSSLISDNHSDHLHLARVATTHPTPLLVRDSSPMTNDPFIATHLITRTRAMLFPFGNNLTPGFH